MRTSSASERLSSTPGSEAHENAGFPTPKVVFELGGLLERAVLIALYRATDGPNWAENGNWVSDAPIGEWHGVTTDAGGRVTKIELGSNWLSGSLPVELGRLSELRVLDFGDNRLAGPIPAWLGGLSNLEHLDLGGNRLNGAIPAELGGLSELRVLHLGENELVGPIPAELGSLHELTVLDLGSNLLDGPLPALARRSFQAHGTESERQSPQRLDPRRARQSLQP